MLTLSVIGGWPSNAAHAGEFPVSGILAPGGEVVFANTGEREAMYGKLNYVAARRAGDFVFLSGVEAGPFEKGDGNDVDAF